MRKKRMMALLLTGVILAGMITGCGNQQTGTPEAKETETAQEQAPGEAQPQEESGGENVNLRFCWWGSDTRHEKTLEALAKYEEMTGVHIEGEYSTISSYYEKLVTQLAGGTAPDIIQLDYPWITELAAQGDFFVNLEEYVIIQLANFRHSSTLTESLLIASTMEGLQLIPVSAAPSITGSLQQPISCTLTLIRYG